ncbi:MAG: asparagine synthetase B [Gemmatimonas sp.]|nr:asparagine synthetase B [Gemmatimonas sp.]
MPQALRWFAVFACLLASRAQAQHVLVPMDDAQANHLKAYGVAFNALTEGVRAEWLINYRGGAFLLPDVPFVRRRAALDGVTFEALADAAVNAIRSEIADGNADAVPLEKAPRIAVYSPPNSPPWDDAVTLALRYAGIPYTRVWDDEVLGQDMAQYDWIHLFHEDFTGQLNKLYLSYRDAPWFIDQRERDLATARRHGYASIPALKKAVAAKIRAFVDRGGFLFAMCGATETLELALASQGVDIAAPYSDGTPIDPDADGKMDWANAMAVSKAHIEMSAGVNAMSDIDGHQVNVPARRQPLGNFQLFAFSAKLDPVATMLVQGHRSVIPDYYGVTTSFSRAVLRPSVTVLAYEDGAPWVKYIHGDLGKGAWTYLGGHDPEDPQHNIGAPPTDLALHPNSPGYRLILNNVLFPAAKKKPHKT